MRVICSLVCLLACATAKKFHTLEEFKRMGINELQMFLAERGKTCKGCSEKDHFVEVAFKNRKKKAKVENIELGIGSQEGDVKSKKGFQFSKEQFLSQVT
jgi:hypothetical protein